MNPRLSDRFGLICNINHLLCGQQCPLKAHPVPKNVTSSNCVKHSIGYNSPILLDEDQNSSFLPLDPAWLPNLPPKEPWLPSIQMDPLLRLPALVSCRSASSPARPDTAWPLLQTRPFPFLASSFIPTCLQ